MSFPKQTSLYLTALLPPDDIAQREYLLKKEISEIYGTKVAIKKPAHITIIPPFRADIEQLEKLVPVYQDVCQKTAPFNILLNGIGNFKNNHVVFIKVEDNKYAEKLYQDLKVSLLLNTWMQLLPRKFWFTKLTPHMTLAYRDLSPETFRLIWDAYKDVEFKADFPVTRLHVLKHINGRWLPYRSFVLEG